MDSERKKRVGSQEIEPPIRIPRRMTQETYNELMSRKAEYERKLTNLSGNGSMMSTLHDNASIFLEQENLRALLRHQIGDLSNVEIITPPDNLSVVNLGTAVTLEYDEANETPSVVQGVILGPDDCILMTSCRAISYLSPVGQQIMRKPVGTEITFGPSRIKIKIVKIENGLLPQIDK